MNLVQSLTSIISKKKAETVENVSENVGFSSSVWSIAGGKGGTGKSVIATNLALGLAMIGYEVILIDGDLGGPNLHNYLNIRRPRYTLNDFVMGQVKKLRGVIIETPLNNLKFISGGTALLGMANIHHAKKDRLLRQINDLAADFILVDLGAGTTYNTLDFFNISNQGLIVVNPDPNSKYDAFYFLKNAVFRKLMRSIPKTTNFQKIAENYIREIGHGKMDIAEFLQYLQNGNNQLFLKVEEILRSYSPRLIVNKVRSRDHNREGKWFSNLVKSYLSIRMDYAGHVEFDKKIMYASEKIMPFMMCYPKCSATKNIYSLIEQLDPNRQKMPVDSFYQFRREIKKYSPLWAN